MIPPDVLQLIDYVISYVEDATNDWFVIKKELLGRADLEEKSLFSRRSQSNRKHIINSFEREVITYWESKTGVTIWIDPEKLQAPDWVRKTRGENLKEINEKRKQQRQEQQELAKRKAKSKKNN